MTSPSIRTSSTSIAFACLDMLPWRNRSFFSSLITSYPEATLNESTRQLEFQSSKPLSFYPQGRPREKRMHFTSFLSAHSFVAAVRISALIHCYSNLSLVDKEVLKSLPNGVGVSHGKHAEPSSKSWPDAEKKRLNALDVNPASTTQR